MGKLTPFGRIAIIAVILGALYGGYVMLKKTGVVGSASTEQVAETSTIPKAEVAGNEATAPTEEQKTFSYTPTPPAADGKLKGVVELGASGFNSFIIKIDKDKNWKLEKAEFGHSLAIENMADKDDIKVGLKKYISGMLEYGVSPKDIHFVVSSGAVKAPNTVKIAAVLKSMGYYVNPVTPEQEGTLGLKTVLPKEYENKAFVVDIGSGNTKISWKTGNSFTALESFGAKYFQNNTSDQTVYDEVVAKSKQIPEANRATCFIIGGVPFEMAKAVRKDKERYTLLGTPGSYQLDNAKSKAGINIYKGVTDATGCEEFIFDWDANFTIGFLLELPY